MKNKAMITKQTEERQVYEAPVVCVLEVRAEDGFALSVEAEDNEIERTYGVW